MIFNIILIGKDIYSIMKTRSNNNSKLNPGLSIIKKTKMWISPTKLRNCVLDDHLMDYIQIHMEQNKIMKQRPDPFLLYLFEKGDEFEEKVVSYINSNIIPVTTMKEPHFTKESLMRVKELIYAGVPIIHSAPLTNSYNATRGVSDLLVRSDYINKIVPNTLTPEEEFRPASKLPGSPNYHYVVIEIKFSTIHLKSDGKNISKTGNLKFYTVQSYIYSLALSYIQGYLPPAFILGRKYCYVSKGVQHKIYNSLAKLARIDFTDDVVSTTKDAMKWVRSLNKDWNKYSLEPPNDTKLYPNMSISSDMWGEKSKIAKDLYELTMISGVSIHEREIAISNDVYGWNDPRCCAEIMGIKNPEKAKYIDAIIRINRDDCGYIYENKINYDFSSYEDDAYIDFEVFQDMFGDLNDFPLNTSKQTIFMIGVYHRGTYKSFIIRSINMTEEKRIMTEFIEYICNLNCKNVWYWHAELPFWNSAIERHNGEITHPSKFTSNWVNLMAIVKYNAFAIKGCFSYGLKCIIKALNTHNLINFKYLSDCNDGMTASIRAYNFYKSPIKSGTILKDIENYNMYDCQAMFEIIRFLKNNRN